MTEHDGDVLWDSLYSSQDAVTHRQVSPAQLVRTEPRSNKYPRDVRPSRLLHPKELSMPKSLSLGYQCPQENKQTKIQRKYLPNLPSLSQDGGDALLTEKKWDKKGRHNELRAAQGGTELL